MAFNGQEGEQISLSEGATYTANYRANNPGKTIAHFMGKTMLMNILNQTGCVGVRVYYGEDSQGDKQLIFVGVDSAQNDIVNGIVADRTYPCPAMCGDSNALNS